MKPRIPTVNDIFQKWHSKTSHVAKVTIVLFLRNPWILLHVLAPCVLLLALSDYAFVLWQVTKTLTRTQWVVLIFEQAYQACDRADFKKGKWKLPSGFVGKDFRCHVREIERLTITSSSQKDCGNGRPSGQLYVRVRGATLRAMHYVGILIRLYYHADVWYFATSF